MEIPDYTGSFCTQYMPIFFTKKNVPPRFLYSVTLILEHDKSRVKKESGNTINSVED